MCGHEVWRVEELLDLCWRCWRVVLRNVHMQENELLQRFRQEPIHGFKREAGVATLRMQLQHQGP